jgi:hypothetical protein
MKTSPLIPNPGKQLWGIYYSDHEFARELGDPIRTVVEAPSKLAAEEAAARLGFTDPWAHPVTHEQIKDARWLPLRRGRQRQEAKPKQARGLHV